MLLNKNPNEKIKLNNISITHLQFKAFTTVPKDSGVSGGGGGGGVTWVISQDKSLKAVSFVALAF